MPAGVALLFPGQGAYVPGCLTNLADFPETRRILDEVDSVAHEYGIGGISALLLDTDAPEIDELLARAPDTLQVAIFAASLVTSRIVTGSAGLRKAVLVGHSLGELTALTAAGVYSVGDGTRVLCERDRLVRAAGIAPGGLMAVGLSAGRTASLLSDEGLADVDVAAYNAPRQTVVSGPDAALDRLASLLAEREVLTKRLQSPYPYHHRVMAPVADELARRVADLPVRALALPVYSTLHLRHYQDGDDITGLLARHLVTPVSFLQALREVQENGTDVFVEAGARTALTGIARSALGHIRTVALLDGVPSAEEFAENLSRIPGVSLSNALPEPRVAPSPAPPDGIRKETGSTSENFSSRDSIISELRHIYAQALEFPEEFLEPTTHLEGDLGVDSVQQTEILSRVIAHYGLDRLPDSFRITQYSTLDAVARFLTERGVRR